MTRRILVPLSSPPRFLATAAATAQPVGVTLYEGVRMTGERFTVTQDVFDLSDTPFGARRASSVDVPRGCRVTLFESSGYRGASLELTARDNDLGNTRLGRGSVASVRVDCRGARDAARGAGGGRRDRGVTLFRDSDLEGTSQTFDEDVPDLERTRIGARQASSIEVPPGCVATLFSETGFPRTLDDVPRDRQQPPQHSGGQRHGLLPARRLRRIGTGQRPRRAEGRREEGRRADRRRGDALPRQGLQRRARRRSAPTSLTSPGPGSAHVRPARSSVSPGCRVTLFSEPGLPGTLGDVRRRAQQPAQHAGRQRRGPVDARRVRPTPPVTRAGTRGAFGRPASALPGPPRGRLLLLRGGRRGHDGLRDLRDERVGRRGPRPARRTRTLPSRRRRTAPAFRSLTRR